MKCSYSVIQHPQERVEHPETSAETNTPDPINQIGNSDENGNIVNGLPESRSSSIPILTTNTLSYEDQNFSYDIDLFTSPKIGEETIFYEPQDRIYEPQNQNDSFESQNCIFSPQNGNVCLSFMQDEQLALQLPLSYVQRPEILVPVSLEHSVSLTEDLEPNIPLLPSTDNETASNLRATPFSQKKSRICLKRKYPSDEEMYDTENKLAMFQRNNTALRIDLEESRNSLETARGEKIQKKPRNFKDKLPRFRENNNWIGKIPKDEFFKDEKNRKKVSVRVVQCKKNNMIRDFSSYRKRIKGNLKMNDVDQKNDKSQDEIKSLTTPNITVEEKASITEIETSLETTMHPHSKPKVKEKHNSGTRSSQKSVLSFDDEKYEMDAELIENYLRSQTKLVVVNSWESYHSNRSNDRIAKRRNNIRPSLVDLPNVLDTKEGKHFYSETMRKERRILSLSFKQPKVISSALAQHATIAVWKENKKKKSAGKDVVDAVLDEVIKDATSSRKPIDTCQLMEEKIIANILDKMLSVVVRRVSK